MSMGVKCVLFVYYGYNIVLNGEMKNDIIDTSFISFV